MKAYNLFAMAANAMAEPGVQETIDVLNGKPFREVISYCPKCQAIWVRRPDTCIDHERMCGNCEIPLTDISEWTMRIEPTQWPHSS